MSKAMITVSGFVSQAAELKQVGEHAVCEFSIPVDEEQRGEKHTVWYRCSIWGKRATALHPILTKGKGVSVIGTFFPREYKSGSGEQRISCDVKVVELDLLGGGDRDHQQQAAPQQHQQRQAPPQQAPQQAPQYHPPGTSPGAGATHVLANGAWQPLAQVAPPLPPAPPAQPQYAAPPPPTGYAPPTPAAPVRPAPF